MAEHPDATDFTLTVTKNGETIIDKQPFEAADDGESAEIYGRNLAALGGYIEDDGYTVEISKA